VAFYTAATSDTAIEYGKKLNRRLTNIIRFLMDECLPPVIRDNRYFMYPFYYFAYRGRNIRETMAFKTRVHEFSEEEYLQFYAGLNSISRNRLTDLNEACIQHILGLVGPQTRTLLDVGCGSGYLLRRIHTHNPAITLAGSDIIPQSPTFPFAYYQSDIHALQPPLAPFDVVTCCHTLEHILELPAAVAHLRRLCSRFLLVVVPCQRYFYYTLDEHVHFFTHAQQLAPMLGLKPEHIIARHKLNGDWLLVIKSGND
jgi:SAM-dependent methyltransferase